MRFGGAGWKPGSRRNRRRDRSPRRPEEKGADKTLVFALVGIAVLMFVLVLMVGFWTT